MAKISAALYNCQTNTEFIFVPILASTTGGLTASFCIFGGIIVTQCNAYIAFASKKSI